MSKTRSATRCPLPRNRHRKMLIALIVGWLAVGLVGCGIVRKTQPRVEYISSDRAVVPLKKGQAAPNDGWFVPPAVMQEVIPCLDERFRSGKTMRSDNEVQSGDARSESSWKEK